MKASFTVLSLYPWFMCFRAAMKLDSYMCDSVDGNSGIDA